MKNFMEGLTDTLDKNYNVSMTENGALGYKKTSHALLDMNFKVASYRSMDEDEIIADFTKALNENFELAITWLFYARDVRGGLGERRLFRILFPLVADSHPEIAKKLLPLIAEYGRWDDLLCLTGSLVEEDVFKIVLKQLLEDMENYKAGKPISLLAKWMPSINTSSKVTRGYAKYFIEKVHTTESKYRKVLSTLRGYLKVTEVDMSANKWNEIDYEKVPSRANLNYKDAFLRHDEERREQFLQDLKDGKAKINSGVLYPHDIVHKYTEGSDNYWYGISSHTKVDPTLEELWKNLPKLGLEDTLVCADGSGSMTCSIGNTNVSALDVADALAIYSSENNNGPYSHKFISFGAEPKLVDINGKTLLDNLKLVRAYNDCGNTNLEAVFDAVLESAIERDLKQEDLPKNILVISDMEFDNAMVGGTCDGWSRTRVDAKLFEVIENKYKEAGYELPRLIFWNVNSRTNTIPVKENKLGVALVSGFSINILKMVMGNNLDPWELLVEMLTSERYKPIYDLVRENE